jgi:hypothetical protein
MATLQLTPLDVSGLTVVTNPCDLRRDIHAFITYVRDREVKRSYRDNQLSKADTNRLVKLLSDPLASEDIKQVGYSSWLNYLDQLVLQLGFVQYDTKGQYRGYSSSEPSFPDNYIHFQKKTYREFLSASLQDQERCLLNSLIDVYSYSSNEFFETTSLSYLDAFDSLGCATGVLPFVNFAQSRRFLLELLQDCESGIWYSTTSLIQSLKTHHPFFLIPENPKRKHSSHEGRYSNFREYTGNPWGNRTVVAETDPDAFERVEGRYVERFLEGIPLSLGYVAVAYGEKSTSDRYPSLGELKAFRLEPRFFQAIRGAIPAPKVTVQPNFEVHVESDFYPAQVLMALRPLTTPLAEDKVIILKLEKKQVAAQLAQNEALDVMALLKQLSGRDLPQNVAIELEEWSGHSDVFTLYEGYGLLEGNPPLEVLDDFTVEQIASALRLVKSPQALFTQLEKAEQVPLLVEHGAGALRPLPKMARTVFPKVAAKTQTKAHRQKAVIKRQVLVTLHFPEKTLLELFRKDLLALRCPVQVDQAQRTLSFPQRFERHLKAISQRLGKDYQIQLEDME